MDSFTIGTGASIYSQKLLPAILSAQHEVILVTCFWAPSKTRTALSSTLGQLATLRASHQCRQPLRLRICFSSRSLVQKLLHTSSPDGYVYPPSAWSETLGLPSPDTLAAGNIDLVVKSIFFLPFSVMHPKFLIVDRQTAFSPSCNVSWEPWLEGCLRLSRASSSNDPIDSLLAFYRSVWDRNLETAIPGPVPTRAAGQPAAEATIESPADMTIKLAHLGSSAPEPQWLPSWHHRNPAFCPFPWQTPTAPATPLNSALLRLFAGATREIYLQTPNLTSPPVLAAMLEAVARGVHVDIVTGRNMMVWEQLLTAFTTTDRCLKRLTRKYKRLCESTSGRSRRPALSGSSDSLDSETQPVSPGALTVSYFRQSVGSTLGEEPVQPHLKLTIVDGEYTVLGSGNMDRASWFTSQELGLFVRDVAFAKSIKTLVIKALEGRADAVFPAP